MALPVSGAPRAPTAADFATAEARAAVHWRDRLDRVRIEGPAEVADIARTLRTALGHILVNRSGPALQPGPRAYARSWIRDGALTSSALLRLGQDDVVRDFLLWYRAVPVRERQGAVLRDGARCRPGARERQRRRVRVRGRRSLAYTIDDGTARTLWPHVRRAIEHMEALRASERTPANLAAERRAYFGMMPPSISHEGYSDKPAYSYWDDFWAAIGYRSAQSLAQALGFPDDARAHRERSATSSPPTCWPRSRPARGTHRLDVLPGAADRGDFDPTSSTVALSPGGLLGTLPDALVRNTFDRYWRDVRPSAATAASRLGSPTRRTSGATSAALCGSGSASAHSRRWRSSSATAGRPAGTNGPRSCCAMRASRASSATCRTAGSRPTRSARCSTCSRTNTRASVSLVLAAGVPLAWFDGPGLVLQDLRTPYGRLGWQGRASIEGSRKVIELDVQSLRTFPPGGVVLRGPWPATARVLVDGVVIPGAADSIRLVRLPAHLRVELPPAR